MLKYKFLKYDKMNLFKPHARKKIAEALRVACSPKPWRRLGSAAQDANGNETSRRRARSWRNA